MNNAATNNFNPVAKTFSFRIENKYDVAKQLALFGGSIDTDALADWIEWCKKNKITLLGADTAICNNKNIRSLDASGWAMKNQETFAKAWLYGYEIEKEKLYTVEIPIANSPLGYHYVLRKTTSGEIIIDSFFTNNWGNYDYCWLTEAEIKKEHEWAWQWAKEV